MQLIMESTLALKASLLPTPKGGNVTAMLEARSVMPQLPPHTKLASGESVFMADMALLFQLSGQLTPVPNRMSSPSI